MFQGKCHSVTPFPILAPNKSICSTGLGCLAFTVTAEATEGWAEFTVAAEETEG